MYYINKKLSDETFSAFLLIWIIFAIFVFVMGIKLFTFSFSVLLFFSIIFIPSILLFLDVYLWQNFGKEIIYTEDKKIIVKKVNRVFPRKKKIRFTKIEDIYIWESKGFLSKDIDRMTALWGWYKQGRICIKYSKGCEYYIGKNLNTSEAEKLLEMVKSEIR